MRNWAVGFLFGYGVVGLIVLPLLLCAIEVVPSYSSGVTMVLDHSGAFTASRRFGAEAIHLRNLAMNDVNRFLGATIFAQAEASGR